MSNGNIENALHKVFTDLMIVLPALKEALENRLSFLTEDPIFCSAAKLLESTSYQNLDEEELLASCQLLAEHFKKPLESNGYIKQRLCKFFSFGIAYSCIIVREL